MSMLLTISQPAKAEFGRKAPHDFSPRPSFTTHTSRFTPNPEVESLVTSLPVSISRSMSTPHRGLPPPAAMALPDPSRPPLSLSHSQQLGAMPEPPRQWQGAEESMRNWLAAKAEEDKRKQEEERTRQETLKLEQRRIEQSMLRESLHGGVPPHTVPMIFAGMAGANLANVSLDWLQQYAAQLQASQQQQVQQASPEVRREPPRMINAPQPIYQQPQQPQQPVPAAPFVASQPAPLQESQSTYPVYQPTPLNTSVSRPPPTSAPRSATHTTLPRLTTNEIHTQHPPQGGPGSAHPLQQSQTLQQDQPASSPSIYFHHWVPPHESKLKDPPTPAGRSNEPHSAHPGSHLSSESDFRNSPRKRKAQGGHDANPAPSAGPAYTSPSFSTTSSTSGRKPGHMRSRSSASMKDIDAIGRPVSRRDSGPQSSQQAHVDRERSEERRAREREREREASRREPAQREASQLAQQASSDHKRREGSHRSESRDRR